MSLDSSKLTHEIPANAVKEGPLDLLEDVRSVNGTNQHGTVAKGTAVRHHIDNDLPDDNNQSIIDSSIQSSQFESKRLDIMKVNVGSLNVYQPN